MAGIRFHRGRTAGRLPQPASFAPPMRGLALGVLRRVAEAAVFGKAGHVAPWLLRAALGLLLRRRRAVAAAMDVGFYLRQLPSPARRAAAARAPALHYLMIGRFEKRAPLARFDPVFYAPGLPASADPFDHFIREGAAAGRPGNEGEARAGAHPPGGAGPAILVFNHGRGGGSTRYIAELERRWGESGHRVVHARQVVGSPSLVVAQVLGTTGQAAAFDLVEDVEAMATFAAALGVERIVVNHLIGQTQAGLAAIPRLAARLGAPYDVVLHDYFCLCPRINLIDADGAYCGVGSPGRCGACLSRGGGEDIAAATPADWRDAWRGFLRAAGQVLAPSADLAGRIGRHIDREILVMPPEESRPPPCDRRPAPRRGEPLRVVIVGGISVPKGLWVVAALARHLQRSGADIRLTGVGGAAEPAMLKRAGVRVTGAYRPEELTGLLGALRPHVALLPSIWPESWSFVLSEVLAHGLPVIAFDLGAPADRLRELGIGTLLPPPVGLDVEPLARHLIALHQTSSTGTGLTGEEGGSAANLVPSPSIRTGAIP